MITFLCSGCGQKLGIKDDVIGKEVRCPKCGVKTRALAALPVAVGAENARTLPPAAAENVVTIPPIQGR